MEKCPWGIGSARALTSPNAEITTGGDGVYVCVQASAAPSAVTKQVLCHTQSWLLKFTQLM